jgi:hypothetical protein
VCELMEVAWSRLLKMGCKKRVIRHMAASKVAPAIIKSDPIQVLINPSRTKDIMRKQANLDLKALEDEYFGELIFM